MQRPRSHHLAVEICPTPAAFVHAAPYDVLGTVHREPALDHEFVACWTDLVAASGLTEQQPQRTDQQRLAGAGLPRDDDQPRLRFDGGVGDDPCVANPELVKHGRYRIAV